MFELDSEQTCDGAVLAVAPNDSDALRCKAVAYVRHEEFEKALQLIHSNTSVAEVLAFEQVRDCKLRSDQAGGLSHT